MKNISYALASLLLCLLLGSAMSNKPSKEATFLTYNINNARGKDGVTDYKRVADFIASCNPDVAAIQELDSATQRSNGAFVLAEIAQQVGMHYTFRASIDRDGGKFGIGVLSKEKPISVKATPLPGRDEARSLLMVEFKDYIFCCTHLSQNGEDRLTSIGIINEQVKDFTKPVFFGGDFNAVPSSAPMTELTKTWRILSDTSAYTLPPGAPTRCLDYVLVKQPQEVEVKSSQVFDIPLAAWHLPVLVKLVY